MVDIAVVLSLFGDGNLFHMPRHLALRSGVGILARRSMSCR